MSEWNPAKVICDSERVRKIIKGKLVYPQMAEVWFTNKCNLNCFFCNEQKLRNELNIDISEDIIDKICSMRGNGGTGLKSVVIEGGGEPTLHPLFDKFAVKLSKFFNVGLITNGTNYINPEVLRKLIFIRISLDSFDFNSYSKVKGKPFFDNVFENIEIMNNDINEECLDTTLGISFVVSSKTFIDEENIEFSISRLFNVLSRFNNIKYIQFKPIENGTQEEDDFYNNFREFILKLPNLYKFKIYFVDCKDKNNGNSCFSNQLSTTILNNGDVLFCKRLKNIINCKIGNLNYDKPSDIFFGEKKRKFVEKYRNQENCSICPTCRLEKYNTFISDNLDMLKTRYFL